MREEEDNLEAANRVASLLAAHGVPGVVIGAVALAVYAICLKNDDEEPAAYLVPKTSCEQES